MNKSILHSAITAALAISITACSSGGGSDVAGIGGSGITSSGTITGFGSVYVNGVKYDTSGSTITIDDNPGIESDLAVGMRVTVNGTLTDDSNGTATSISFNDDLEGTNFDFSSIVDGNHVEISGFLDANGVMIATRVELKNTNFTHNGTIVEMKGTVTGFNSANDTFTLANTTGVTIDATGIIPDNSLPNGIVDDAFVEVKGTCSSGACTTINARKVESGLDDFNNDDVEVEGVITDLTSQEIFEVNGIAVDATNATRIPTSINLAENREVEVEGSFNGTTLIATKVKDESNDIKVAATVSNPALSADSFQVTLVSGQPPITIKIDKSTEVDDDIDNITNSDNLITNLSNGDYVVIEGYDDGTGKVIASKFKRESLNPGEVGDVILQGIMQSFTPDDEVTVLEVEFQVQLPETEFEGPNDLTPFSQAQFDAGTTDGVTLIKIKDKDDSGINGVADEIEIELP